jgi:spore maturation protein CgeB
VRWLACQPGPAWSVKDVHVGWVEALRNAGETVLDYPLGSWLTFFGEALLPRSENEFFRAMSNEQAIEASADRLAAALWKTRPDLLLLTSGFFLPAPLLDTARRDGVKIVVICTEQPYELGRELDVAAHSDIALLTDPTTIDRFREVCTAVHQPHCYRPTLHTPGPAVPELAADFAFVGTGYESRIRFLEQMRLDGLDVLLAGNWAQLAQDSPLRRFVAGGLEDCLDNDKTVDVYRSAKVGINLYRREAETPELSAGWAVGPREVEMAACGAFFLRDPRPEGDELFPSLPTFTAPEEAGELLRWHLANPAAREAAAHKAREAVADRTFDNAAAALLRLITEE